MTARTLVLVSLASTSLLLPVVACDDATPPTTGLDSSATPATV